MCTISIESDCDFDRPRLACCLDMSQLPVVTKFERGLLNRNTYGGGFVVLTSFLPNMVRFVFRSLEHRHRSCKLTYKGVGALMVKQL